MSNEVYGYLKKFSKTDWSEFFEEMERNSGIGIKEIPMSELHSFPQEVMPINNVGCAAFVVGDRPGKTNTSYLTDYADYDSDANLGLPNDGRERLDLLIGLFAIMMRECMPGRFVVLITECGQVEAVKVVEAQDLGSQIRRDFERFSAPSDYIYDVACENGTFSTSPTGETP